MTFATIVLLIKNGEKYLQEILSAIYAQETDFDFEVLAVDSGSKDQSLQILKQFPVRLIQIPPQSFNHGDTRNFGAEQACPESEYIVYLTQDATPLNTHWLANLLKPLRKDSRVAGAFSRHVPRPGTSPSLYRQAVHIWQTGGTQTLYKQAPADPVEYQRDKFHYIYFSDTSSAIRRSVWQETHFPRTSFAEDALWADAVLQAGYAIVYEPSSQVLHSHNYPLVEQFRQNVDHTAAMKRLFQPPDYDRPGFEWWQIRAIPRQVWRDWFFILHSPDFQPAPFFRKLGWMWLSPWWHFATALGVVIGVNLENLPNSFQLLFSRQERMRRQ